MAPPNESKATSKVAATPAPKLAAAAAATAKGCPASSSSSAPCLFSLQDGELTVGGGDKAALLTGVLGNITLTPFAKAFDPAAAAADSPRVLAERAAARFWASRCRRRRAARRAAWGG